MRRRAMLIMIGSLSWAVILQAGGLPLVTAEFIFDSPLTIKHLGGARQTREDEHSTAVFNAFAPRYGLFDWCPPKKDVKTAARVIVKLREEKSGNKSAYYLDYWRQIGEGPAELMRYVGERQPLYKRGSFAKPWDDPNFKDRLDEQLLKDVDASRAELQREFVRMVPISSAIPVPDPDASVLVVDVPWNKLRAASVSRLEVKVDDELRAYLTPIQKHVSPNGDPVVGGQIENFYSPPDPPRKQWHDDIPKAIKRDVGKRIVVVMFDYEPAASPASTAPGKSGPIAVTPDH